MQIISEEKTFTVHKTLAFLRFAGDWKKQTSWFAVFQNLLYPLAVANQGGSLKLVPLWPRWYQMYPLKRHNQNIHIVSGVDEQAKFPSLEILQQKKITHQTF